MEDQFDDDEHYKMDNNEDEYGEEVQEYGAEEIVSQNSVLEGELLSSEMMLQNQNSYLYGGAHQDES
jgi:hypothetical protein